MVVTLFLDEPGNNKEQHAPLSHAARARSNNLRAQSRVFYMSPNCPRPLLATNARFIGCALDVRPSRTRPTHDQTCPSLPFACAASA
jgi:hypothetical protein